MGLGLLGRGVGDAVFLAESGAKLIITDLKHSNALKSSLLKLRKFNNIKYVLGKHRLEDFKKADMILKAAGVPQNSPYIKEARKNKIKVEMSATFFAKLSGLPIIGVTGTRGKSTVAHLIAHILKSSGRKVILGGNIRGVSNLQLFKQAKHAEIAILELDSWQLQGFRDAKISPHISVFTTFFPDHMVYYDKKMKKYFLDKAYIFKNQNKKDVLIAGSQVSPFIIKWGGKIKSKIIAPKIKNFKMKIHGEHNLYNANLAAEAAKVIGISEVVIKKAIENFNGVEGRMQFLREVRGIKYYNDTTATTPEATLAALHTLGKDKKLILIAGGSDKSLNMSALIREIPKFCKKVVLLPGTGTKRVEGKIYNKVKAKNLKDAVSKAQKLALKGDTVILSPAFASFGLFKNEYDRGDQFMQIVRNLK